MTLLTPAAVLAANRPRVSADTPDDGPFYTASYTAACPVCGCDATWSTSSDARTDTRIDCWCCDVQRLCRDVVGRHRAPDLVPAGTS